MGEDDWARLESRLRDYVRQRVDTGSVDDVVGDILLRLVQHRDQLAAAANPTAWMRRVAANAITDHYRRNAAQDRALAQAGIEDALDKPDDPEADTTAAAHIAGCLIPFIHGLPEPYRDALMLTEIDGLTQEAAARQLGLSTSGMKSRVQRGRAKLKQALLRCCAIELDRRGGVIDYRRRACAPDCA